MRHSTFCLSALCLSHFLVYRSFSTPQKRKTECSSRFHDGINDRIDLCLSVVQLLIYTKTLSLSMWNFSSHAVSVGQIVSYLSVDASNMMFCCCVIHFVWLLPLKVGQLISVHRYMKCQM